MFSYKPWLGVLFLLAYAVYLLRELRGGTGFTARRFSEPLKFHAKGDPGCGGPCCKPLSRSLPSPSPPRSSWGNSKPLACGRAYRRSSWRCCSAPSQPSCPKPLNALIWVRQGKERLALANISGAMMIQATIPTALGLFYTSWVFSRQLIVSAVITLIAVAALLGLFSRGAVNARSLVPLAGLYALFVAVIVVW